MLLFSEDVSGYLLSITLESKIKIEKLVIRLSKKNERIFSPIGQKTVLIHGKNYNRSIFKIDGIYNEEKQKKFKYWFIVSNNKQIKSKYYFLRFPLLDPSKPLRIVLFGDIQMQEPLGILETYMIFLVRKIGKPDFIICMGDLVEKYNKLPAWHYFFRMMRKIMPNTPFYTTVGNHCGGADGGQTLLQFLSTPSESLFYSFQIRNALFITINSLIYNSNQGYVQLEWLKNQLKNLDPSIKFVIFWAHMPTFGPPYNYKDYSPYERVIEEKLKSIFEKYPVDLQFYGHKHSYSREGNKIITASIHGVRKYRESWTEEKKLKNRHHFCILEINEQRMIMRAISWWGSEMDRTEIEK